MHSGSHKSPKETPAHFHMSGGHPSPAAPPPPPSIWDDLLTEEAPLNPSPSEGSDPRVAAEPEAPVAVPPRPTVPPVARPATVDDPEDTGPTPAPSALETGALPAIRTPEPSALPQQPAAAPAAEAPASPRVTPGRPTPRAPQSLQRPSRGWLIGGMLLLGVVGGALLATLQVSSGPTPDLPPTVATPPEPPPPPAASVTLTIDTEPAGAGVYALDDDTLLGTTPLELPDPEVRRILVVHPPEGAEPRSPVHVVVDPGDGRLMIDLAAEQPQTTLVITADGFRDASVRIDGTTRGPAPLVAGVEPGPHVIELIADRTAPLRQDVDATENTATRVRFQR